MPSSSIHLFISLIPSTCSLLDKLFGKSKEELAKELTIPKIKLHLNARKTIFRSNANKPELIQKLWEAINVNAPQPILSPNPQRVEVNATNILEMREEDVEELHIMKVRLYLWA